MITRALRLFLLFKVMVALLPQIGVPMWAVWVWLAFEVLTVLNEKHTQWEESKKRNQMAEALVNYIDNKGEK